jgi:DNA-binding NarL/FixJ family response regulator
MHRGRTVVVDVLSSHRMAGTALAQLLRSHLDVAVAVHDPAHPVPARVAVLLTPYLPAESVPQVVLDVIEVTPSVVLVYDGLAAPESFVAVAHDLGAHSTFDVRGDPRALVQQIQLAMKRRHWVHDWPTQGWTRSLEHEPSGLTPREQQVVMQLFARPGGDVATVAQELGVSVSTVRVHLGNVRRKLAGTYTGNLAALRTALIDRGWLPK